MKSARAPLVDRFRIHALLVCVYVAAVPSSSAAPSGAAFAWGQNTFGQCGHTLDVPEKKNPQPVKRELLNQPVKHVVRVIELAVGHAGAHSRFCSGAELLIDALCWHAKVIA